VEAEVSARCHTEAMDLLDMAYANLSHFMEDVPTALSLEQAVAAYLGGEAVAESSVADAGFVAGGYNILGCSGAIDGSQGVGKDLPWCLAHDRSPLPAILTN
jgi:hypothetical protein